VLAKNKSAALVECRPMSGRLHQVRVHMEAIGCSILGDGLYALWDGQDIALFTTTHSGKAASDIVYLDPEVQVSFARFMEDIIDSKIKPVKFSERD
jgi:23S rRNA-/tRNA-specific pseudouridylate synthase